eukprot:Lankesteria_metandrocarpae@DN3624_c0_g1_i2.p1
MNMDLTGSSVVSNIKTLFGNNVRTMVQGLRTCPENEEDYLMKCAQSIRQEIASSDVNTKANAVAKMWYLHMLGHDMAWAAFAIVELMSTQKFHIKHPAYFACAVSFDDTTDVSLLVTNLFRKDFASKDMFDTTLALSCLASMGTPELCRDLYSDTVSLLSSSKAYVRKKAILCLCRIFMKHPASLRASFSRIRERLEDDDQGVLTATVSVLLELASKNPEAYLSLVPRLYHLLVNTQNNWMAIKMMRFFNLLCGVEPKLPNKLLGTVMSLMQTTRAKSVEYEAMKLLLMRMSNVPSVVDSALEHLQGFVDSCDKNLKYIGLLILSESIQNEDIAARIPRVFPELHRKTLEFVEDPDETVRRAALSMLRQIATPTTFQDIVEKLLTFSFEIPTSSEIFIEAVLTMAPEDDYRLVVADIGWYLTVLADISRHHCTTKQAATVAAQLTTLAVERPYFREAAVCLSALLVGNSTDDDTTDPRPDGGTGNSNEGVPAHNTHHNGVKQTDRDTEGITTEETPAVVDPTGTSAVENEHTMHEGEITIDEQLQDTTASVGAKEDSDTHLTHGSSSAAVSDKVQITTDGQLLQPERTAVPNSDVAAGDAASTAVVDVIATSNDTRSGSTTINGTAAAATTVDSEGLDFDPELSVPFPKDALGPMYTQGEQSSLRKESTTAKQSRKYYSNQMYRKHSGIEQPAVTAAAAWIIGEYHSTSSQLLNGECFTSIGTSTPISALTVLQRLLHHANDLYSSSKNRYLCLWAAIKLFFGVARNIADKCVSQSNVGSDYLKTFQTIEDLQSALVDTLEVLQSSVQVEVADRAVLASIAVSHFIGRNARGVDIRKLSTALNDAASLFTPVISQSMMSSTGRDNLSVPDDLDLSTSFLPPSITSSVYERPSLLPQIASREGAEFVPRAVGAVPRVADYLVTTASSTTMTNASAASLKEAASNAKAHVDGSATGGTSTPTQSSTANNSAMNAVPMHATTVGTGSGTKPAPAVTAVSTTPTSITVVAEEYAFPDIVLLDDLHLRVCCSYRRRERHISPDAPVRMAVLFYCESKNAAIEGVKLRCDSLAVNRSSRGKDKGATPELVLVSQCLQPHTRSERVKAILDCPMWQTPSSYRITAEAVYLLDSSALPSTTAVNTHTTTENGKDSAKVTGHILPFEALLPATAVLEPIRLSSEDFGRTMANASTMLPIRSVESFTVDLAHAFTPQGCPPSAVNWTAWSVQEMMKGVATLFCDSVCEICNLHCVLQPLPPMENANEPISSSAMATATFPTLKCFIVGRVFNPEIFSTRGLASTKQQHTRPTASSNKTATNTSQYDHAEAARELSQTPLTSLIVGVTQFTPRATQSDDTNIKTSASTSTMSTEPEGRGSGIVVENMVLNVKVSVRSASQGSAGVARVLRITIEDLFKVVKR